MSVSMSITSLNLDKTSLELDSLYSLKEFKTEADIMCKAYKYSEYDYVIQYQVISFMVIILSSVSSIVSGLQSSGMIFKENLSYIMLAISVLTVIAASLDKVLQPKNKQHESNKMCIEFHEISHNIDLFQAGDNDAEAIKLFVRQTSFMLDAWKSLAPPINPKYIKKASLEMTSRPRRMKSPRAKKNETDG